MLESNIPPSHYNPNLPFLVVVDTSNYGAGVVIFHAFSPTVQIRLLFMLLKISSQLKELQPDWKGVLGHQFYSELVHNFVYGRHFTLLTDHKPPLSIFGYKKGIPVYTTSRLQRWSTSSVGFDSFILILNIGTQQNLDKLVVYLVSPTVRNVLLGKLSLQVWLWRTKRNAHYRMLDANFQ